MTEKSPTKGRCLRLENFVPNNLDQDTTGPLGLIMFETWIRVETPSVLVAVHMILSG